MNEFARRKQYVQVLGSNMAYLESGEGEPVLFLHGNPTSSYLWRNVMPEVSGRCIAPDLMGMGDSAKLESPERAYTFDTHARHLEGLIARLIGGQPVWLVLHDWGSGLGFDWANRHREQVRGIAYMEGIVQPIARWEDWNADSARIFQGFRSDKGEDLVLDRNLFIEKVLPGSVLRGLDEQEMAEYRRPFQRREDRWPTLSWPRSIPIAGEPADVVERVQAYADWLSQSEVPKLFINAEPGAILVGAAREFCRRWPNQHEVTVAGSHFIQEDSGPEIGKAIALWMESVQNSG